MLSFRPGGRSGNGALDDKPTARIPTTSDLVAGKGKGAETRSRSAGATAKKERSADAVRCALRRSCWAYEHKDHMIHREAQERRDAAIMNLESAIDGAQQGEVKTAMVQARNLLLLSSNGPITMAAQAVNKMGQFDTAEFPASGLDSGCRDALCLRMMCEGVHIDKTKQWMPEKVRSKVVQSYRIWMNHYMEVGWYFQTDAQPDKRGRRPKRHGKRRGGCDSGMLAESDEESSFFCYFCGSTITSSWWLANAAPMCVDEVAMLSRASTADHGVIGNTRANAVPFIPFIAPPPGLSTAPIPVAMDWSQHRA